MPLCTSAQYKEVRVIGRSTVDGRIKNLIKGSMSTTQRQRQGAMIGAGVQPKYKTNDLRRKQVCWESLVSSISSFIYGVVFDHKTHYVTGCRLRWRFKVVHHVVVFRRLQFPYKKGESTPTLTTMWCCGDWYFGSKGHNLIGRESDKSERKTNREMFYNPRTLKTRF